MSKYTRRGSYALKKSRLVPDLQDLLDEYASFSSQIRTIWEEKIKDKKACKPGCNHCCYLLSMISFSDALMVAQYLISHNMHDQIEDLQSMSNLQKSFLKDYDRFKDEEAFVDAWMDEWVPCPLLTNDGLCSVYPVRPTACWHHASGDESGCRRENVKTAATAFRQPRILEALTKADFELWIHVLGDRAPLPLPTSVGIVLALGFIISGSDLENLKEHMRVVPEGELEFVKDYAGDKEGSDREAPEVQ